VGNALWGIPMLLTAIKKTNTLPESLAKGELGTADEKLTSREIINHSPKCLLVIKLLNYQLNKRKTDLKGNH